MGATGIATRGDNSGLVEAEKICGKPVVTANTADYALHADALGSWGGGSG